MSERDLPRWSDPEHRAVMEDELQSVGSSLRITRLGNRVTAAPAAPAPPPVVERAVALRSGGTASGQQPSAHQRAVMAEPAPLATSSAAAAEAPASRARGAVAMERPVASQEEHAAARAAPAAARSTAARLVTRASGLQVGAAAAPPEEAVAPVVERAAALRVAPQAGRRVGAVSMSSSGKDAMASGPANAPRAALGAADVAMVLTTQVSAAEVPTPTVQRSGAAAADRTAAGRAYDYIAAQKTASALAADPGATHASLMALQVSQAPKLDVAESASEIIEVPHELSVGSADTAAASRWSDSLTLPPRVSARSEDQTAEYRATPHRADVAIPALADSGQSASEALVAKARDTRLVTKSHAAAGGISSSTASCTESKVAPGYGNAAGLYADETVATRNPEIDTTKQMLFTTKHREDGESMRDGLKLVQFPGTYSMITVVGELKRLAGDEYELTGKTVHRRSGERLLPDLAVRGPLDDHELSRETCTWELHRLLFTSIPVDAEVWKKHVGGMP